MGDQEHPITNKDVEDKINAATKGMNLILTGVVVVMFIGFLTLLVAVLSPIIDAWRFRASTYEDLVNQVNQQSTTIQNMNGKIDALTNEICQQDKVMGLTCSD